MALFTQSLPLCLLVLLAPEKGEAFVSWRNNLRYPLTVGVRADNRWPRSDGRGDSIRLDEEILHVEGPGVSRQEPFTVSREMNKIDSSHYNNWLGHNRAATSPRADEYRPARTDIPYADRMKQLAAAREASKNKENAPLNPQTPEMGSHQDGSPGRPDIDAQQPPPVQNDSFAPPVQREPPTLPPATTHSHLNNWLGHNKVASWPSRRMQDEINPVTGEKFYSNHLSIRRPNVVPNNSGGLNSATPNIASPGRNNNNNAIPSRPSVAAIESYLDGMPGRAPKELIPPPVTKDMAPPPDVNGAYSQSNLPLNPYLDRDTSNGVVGNSPPVPNVSFNPNQGGAAFPTSNGALENTAANNPGSYLDSVGNAPPVAEYRNGANSNSVPSTPDVSYLDSVSGRSPPSELSNGVNGSNLGSPRGSVAGSTSPVDSSKAWTPPQGSAGMPGGYLNGFAGATFSSTNDGSQSEGGTELPKSYLDAIARSSSSSSSPTDSSTTKTGDNAVREFDDALKGRDEQSNPRETHAPGRGSFSENLSGASSTKGTTAVKDDALTKNPAERANGAMSSFADNLNGTPSNSGSDNATSSPLYPGVSTTADSPKADSSKATSQSQGSAGMPGGFGGASSFGIQDVSSTEGGAGMPQSYLDAIANSSKPPSAGSMSTKENKTMKDHDVLKSTAETRSFSDNLSRPSSTKNDDAISEKAMKKLTDEIGSVDYSTKATGVPGCLGSISDSSSSASSPTAAQEDDATSKKSLTEGGGVPGLGSFSDSLSRASSTEDSAMAKEDDTISKKSGKEVTGTPGVGSFSDSLSMAAAVDVRQESESGTSGISSSYLDAIGALSPRPDSETKVPANAVGISQPLTDSAIEKKADVEVETPAEPVPRGPAPERGKFAEILKNTPPPITDAVVVKRRDDPTKKPVDVSASSGSFVDKLRDRSSSRNSTAGMKRNDEAGPTKLSDGSSGRPRVIRDGNSAANDLPATEKDVVVPSEPYEMAAQARKSFSDSLRTTPLTSSSIPVNKEEDDTVKQKTEERQAPVKESFPDRRVGTVAAWDTSTAKDVGMQAKNAFEQPAARNIPLTSSSIPVNREEDDTVKQKTEERQTPVKESFPDRRVGTVSAWDDSAANDDGMQAKNAFEQSSAAMGSFLDNLRGARSPSTQTAPTAKSPFDTFVDAVKEKVGSNQQGNNLLSTTPMTPQTSSEEVEPSSASIPMDKPADGLSPVSRRGAPQKISIPQLMGRLRQGAHFGNGGNTDESIERERLTLEERIAASIAETRSIEVSERTYETTREKLRYARTKTERRLSRALLEQERAAAKIADIRAKMEAKIRAVEDQLGAKLDKNQVGIDEEVGRMADLLVSEYKQEVGRQENLAQLLDVLEGLIAVKEIDISNEKRITDEMVDVRSKLKDGTIAEELDEMIDQKLRTAAIEQELVNALYDCLEDLQVLLGESRDRAARSKNILEGLARDRPEASSPKSYDWTDFVELEAMLKQAADNVRITEDRIREVSERIDDALVDRAVVLGEDVPPGLENAARRAAMRIIKKLFSSPDVDLDLGFEGLMELKNKDAKELFAILTKSVGRASGEGSRTGIFSLKSLMDALKGKRL